MSKKLCLFVIAIIVTMCLGGCMLGMDATYKYKETDDGYSLVKYEGTSKDTKLVIPDLYDDKPITKLLDFSISQNKYLTEVKIGKNVKVITDRAIMGNDMLEKIEVDAENQYFTSIDGVLFTKDMKILVAFPSNKVPNNGEYIIPDGVEIISDNAFYQCNNENFTKLKMPNTVKRINDRAFMRCNFKVANISTSCEYIGIDAFSKNSSLLNIFIPQSVTEIGDYAFDGCTKLPNLLMERGSLDGVKTGKKWLPLKSNSLFKTIDIIFDSKEA